MFNHVWVNVISLSGLSLKCYAVIRLQSQKCEQFVAISLHCSCPYLMQNILALPSVQGTSVKI